jgi:hypothetical protein
MNNIASRTACSLALALSATVILTAAEPTFNGTWKLNVARSQLGGVVYTFEKKPSGAWHYDGGGFTADFDLTGKELNATSWELTFKMNGKLLSKSRVSLSGDKLMWASEMTGPDGKSVQQNSTDTRVSGGPGFAGKWKAGDIKGASTSLQITSEGADGITITIPEVQQVVKGRFDGKDNPVTQAGQATKFTNAFAKAGSNSLKITTKLNGKLFAEDVYTLSADGKTLTDETTVTATKEKTKSVFDRQ